jgi:hypothetical protein
MRIGKKSFLNKLKDESISTHFTGSINNITGFSLCIFLVLICVLLLVGILS